MQLELDGIGEDHDAGWNPAQWDEYFRALKEEGARYRPKILNQVRTGKLDPNPVRTLRNRITREVRRGRRKL